MSLAANQQKMILYYDVTLYNRIPSSYCNVCGINNGNGESKLECPIQYGTGPNCQVLESYSICNHLKLIIITSRVPINEKIRKL